MTEDYEDDYEEDYEDYDDDEEDWEDEEDFMKHEEFERILCNVLEDSRKVLSAKAKEYASSNDRLHNFKAAAAIDGETPERALWGNV